MEHGKVIGSVNFLDLRKATEESIRAYESFGSVNVAIVSPETRHLLHQMKIGSINATAEVDANIKFEVIMGPLHMGSDYFVQSTDATGLFVMGPVAIDPDVCPDDLKRGLAALIVMGPVKAPAPLAGVLQEITKVVMGPVDTYPVHESVHKGDLRIDRHYLDSLQAGTEMTVVGSVTTEDGIPAGAIRKKLSKLCVTGTTTCFEDQAAEIKAALSGGVGRLRVVPNGFKVVERAVRLDPALLESITDRKLYFLQTVEIDREVSSDLYARKIDGIGCRGWLIAPALLQPQIGKTCDLLNTRAFFYEGKLLRITGETTLTANHFDYAEGKLALYVTGVLQIDPSVAPELLAQRVDKVFLSGVIQCSTEQQAALESRMDTMNGVFDRYWEEEEHDKEGICANVLAL